MSVKANFRALGKRFGKGTQPVAEAIANADAASLVAVLRARGAAEVTTAAGETIALSDEDIVITETPVEGWAVAVDGGDTLALDLEVTPELRRAGLARETVRLVQEARKSSGLAVSDRISLTWMSVDDELAVALREHGSLVADEVLATTYVEGDASDLVDATQVVDDGLGLTVWIWKA